MKARIAAGAEVDFLTKDELADEMKALRTFLGKRLGQRPIVQTVEGTTTLDGSGNGSINLGAPAPGRAWDVRRVNITPQNPAAAAMTVVVVIWRGNDSGNPFYYVDRNIGAGTIPAVSPWSSRQFTVRQDEPIIITFTGGTANTGVFASAQVLEAPFAEIYGRDLS